MLEKEKDCSYSQIQLHFRHCCDTGLVILCFDSITLTYSMHTQLIHNHIQYVSKLSFILDKFYFFVKYIIVLKM